MLDTVVSYHCMQFQGKCMIQTQENDEKPHFEPDFGPLAQIRAAKFFFFFFKNLDSSVTRYHCQLSSCNISEKTNDPMLRKFSER